MDINKTNETKQKKKLNKNLKYQQQKKNPLFKIILDLFHCELLDHCIIKSRRYLLGRRTCSVDFVAET